MGRVRIHGAEYPASKIFSNDFVFTIPLYQRPYAWQREQAEELLDDLLSFIGTGSEPVDDLNPYFLGSIVLIKEEHKPDTEVVDGQQRLTTLTILLSALRHLVQPDFRKALNKYIYEEGDPIEMTPDRFRLTLRQRDAEFFRQYIQKENQIEALRKVDAGKLTDSQRNIRGNAIMLLDRLQDLSVDQRKRLAQFIAKQCLLVVVSTPDFDSAYRIFSILNNRGLDLSHSDILKSELTGKVPQGEQETYAKRWEDAEELLGREAFSALFAHIRMIYRKLKQRDTILKEFREYVVKPFGDPKKVIDGVLVPFAQAFKEIRSASYVSARGADEINRLLKWLNRIDNIDWVPPAILYLSLWGDDPAALNRFFTDLERLAAVLMILRANINHRIERYSSLMTAIENDDDLYAESSPLQLTSKERINAPQALIGDIYEQVPPLRTYLLLRLDSILSGGGATYEYDLVTVEHILPQNPEKGSEWETWWPDAIEREQSVHKLGNLALLTRQKNSSARNFEFGEKKTSYFLKGGVSPFTLTTQVVSETEWTPAVFRRRQAELLQKFVNVWRLLMTEEVPAGEVAGPSAVKESKVREPSTEKKEAVPSDLHTRFFTSLHELAAKKTDLHAAAPPGPKGLSISIAPGMSLVYGFSEGLPRVSLYLLHTKGKSPKEVFDLLHSQKVQIEERFGRSLNWKRMDDQKGSQVMVSLLKGSVQDESNWAELQDRLVDLMIRFKAALKPSLDAITG